MAIQFPPTPDPNDTFVDPDTGNTYQWDGTKWNLLPGDADVFWQGNGNDIFYNNGNVGIGNGVPVHQLDLNNSGSTFWEAGFDAAQAGANLDLEITSSGTSGGRTGQIRFLTGTGPAEERARIDAAGRLLVGDNEIAGAPLLKIGGDVDNPLNGGSIALVTPRVPPNGSTLGVVNFGGSAGRFGVQMSAHASGGWSTDNTSHPSELRFSTADSGSVTLTERMRLQSDGSVLQKSDNGNVYAFKTGAGPGTAQSLTLQHSVGGITGTNNVCFIVFSNGDVQNTSGNAITPIGSERRIKDKIGSFDPTEAWNVVKNATPRPYELKEMPGTQCYGYIVDELEPIDPALILPGTTSDDQGPIRTYDSNRLAYMYRVALKEALGRIEQLEGMVAVNNITIEELQRGFEQRLQKLEGAG